MKVPVNAPLFAWEWMPDSLTLEGIREFLESVPDGKLVASLESWRGKGRDDYPIHVLWGTLLLQIALRHTTMEGCLEELRRNRDLRRLVGAECEDQVPKAWNMSRFLKVLGQEPHRTWLRGVFDEMVKKLARAVPDLGRETAGDSTGLSARRSRSKADRPKKKQEALPEPDGGRKEYTDEAGNVVEVVEWFGYKFHLLVDKRHEVVLAWRVTSTKEGDNEGVEALVKQGQQNVGKGRMKTLAYDKAADDEKVHAFLNQNGIRPVIQVRALWKEEKERMLPGHDGRSNVVYDEAGTVWCYDKVSRKPVCRKMSYIGHEPSRGTLKYRCPARHEGLGCASEERCNAGKKYGKTVRVKQEWDLRRFPPIPRATRAFERLYKGRTAVERVIARTKVFWGSDDGNITGPERFHAYIGAVMVVHAALATLLASAPRVEPGTLGRMRLGPVQQALRKNPKPA
jgi:hypothetical protein